MTDEPNTPRSEPELLPVVSTTISEYSPIAAGLADLRSQVEAHLDPTTRTLTLDCSTTAGDKVARQSRFALVKLRTSLEERRKEIKAPALERCKLIDAEAKRITAEIEALEKPFDDAIKAQEAKVAAEKAEADRREQARKAAVEAEIEGVRQIPLSLMASPSAEVEAALVRVQSLNYDHLTDAVERDRAQTVQRGVITSLTYMHAQRLQAEEEAEKLAAERAENERIAREAAERREQEERQRREQQAREDAERAERQAAEDAEREAARVAEEQAAAQRRAEEQLEANRRAANEAVIRRVRDKPVDLLHAPSSLLEDAITVVENMTAREAGIDEDYTDAFIETATEALGRLRHMLGAAQQREQQEKEYRELQAQREQERQAAAQKAREEAQLRERERVQREEEAIATATLREAATDALAFLMLYHDEDHLVVRKLAAALAREVQP